MSHSVGHHSKAPSVPPAGGEETATAESLADCLLSCMSVTPDGPGTRPGDCVTAASL